MWPAVICGVVCGDLRWSAVFRPTALVLFFPSVAEGNRNCWGIGMSILCTECPSSHPVISVKPFYCHSPLELIIKHDYTVQHTQNITTALKIQKLFHSSHTKCFFTCKLDGQSISSKFLQYFHTVTTLRGTSATNNYIKTVRTNIFQMSREERKWNGTSGGTMACRNQIAWLNVFCETGG